jgi:hypothetical protein
MQTMGPVTLDFYKIVFDILVMFMCRLFSKIIFLKTDFFKTGIDFYVENEIAILTSF